jgi:hypothetical protein
MVRFAVETQIEELDTVGERHQAAILVLGLKS